MPRKRNIIFRCDLTGGNSILADNPIKDTLVSCLLEDFFSGCETTEEKDDRIYNFIREFDRKRRSTCKELSSATTSDKKGKKLAGSPHNKSSVASKIPSEKVPGHVDPFNYEFVRMIPEDPDHFVGRNKQGREVLLDNYERDPEVVLRDTFKAFR